MEKIKIVLEEKNRGDKVFTVDQESVCDNWFAAWADNYLTEAFRQGKYKIDWSGNTRGHNCVCELKTRFCYHNKYKGCYIEADKYANLMNEWVFKGNEPLYFAHYTDGVMIEWNLRKLKQPPYFMKTRGRNLELSKELSKILTEKLGVEIEVDVMTETAKGDLLISDAFAAYDAYGEQIPIDKLCVS